MNVAARRSAYDRVAEAEWIILLDYEMGGARGEV
jgi:hypothetical protein